jgi:hypothetical protein
MTDQPKDPIAQVLEALEQTHDYLVKIDEDRYFESKLCTENLMVIAALQQIKDHQAQPVEQKYILDDDENIRPLLYTETINDKQVCRDDIWLVTTKYIKEHFKNSPVEQAHGVMPDNLRELRREIGKAATGSCNCKSGGGPLRVNHNYACRYRALDAAMELIDSLYTSPPPSPQSDKHLVAGSNFMVGLDSLLRQSESFDGGNIKTEAIRSYVMSFCRCDTAEPSGLCSNCIADGKCMKRQAMCVANGTAKEQGRDDVVAAMKKMKADERMEVMGNFCRYCGCDNPLCQCWNDE